MSSSGAATSSAHGWKALLFAGLAALLLLGGPAAVQAQTRGAEGVADVPSFPSSGVWYGWQTLTVDGASMLVGLAGLSSSAPALLLVGLGGLVLGAPIVHVAHGNLWALASVGLRLTSMALAVVGFNNCQNFDSGSDRSGCALRWAVLGLPLAIVLDAAIWARDDANPSRSGATRSRLLVLGPYVEPHGAGGGLVAAWKF